MQAFLEYVVKGLVDHPEAVEISPTDRSGMTVFELRLDPSDVGKVIGRRGNTIQAIRALMQVGAAKTGVRCTVDIVEDEPRR
jgi:predicted RNA-binding protein YlqC (UPF0109 family)